jgi:hypothetical protein
MWQSNITPVTNPDPSDGDAVSDMAPLKAAMSMLEPIAAILLTSQIGYNEAAAVLKAAFVQASARAFVARGKVPSVSTLSVATGLGRVEVKRLLESPLADRARKVSPASMVRLRWTTDPAYLDEHGQPRRLLRSAGKVSFAQLAEAASRDTHPRAILDELLRLGAVVEEGDYVSLRHEGAYRPVGANDALVAGADNASDHLSAVLVNLLSPSSPLLERAIFADRLTHASAIRGVAAASEIWVRMLGELREKLQALVSLDDGVADNEWRMRIGVYSYVAPMFRPAPAVSARENKRRSGSSRNAGLTKTTKRPRSTRQTG